MKTIYPAMIVVSLLLAVWAAVLGVCLLTDDSVELSRENIYSHYDFTREVFAGCPIEKAELNVDTNVLTVYYPREEYRGLRQRLERQGWAEQGAESGLYRQGAETIVVERGALTILPSMVQR